MSDRAPIEVEVVEHVLCPQCQMVGGRTHQSFCNRTGDHTATLAPGSLDEALHRLGLATDEYDRLHVGVEDMPLSELGAFREAQRDARSRHEAALAEVRRLREAQG